MIMVGGGWWLAGFGCGFTAEVADTPQSSRRLETQDLHRHLLPDTCFITHETAVSPDIFIPLPVLPTLLGYKEREWLLPSGSLFLGMFVVCLLGLPAWAAGPTVSLAVDASTAPRKIFHARLRIPASAGTLTLYYPKWIPGVHRPTGPGRLAGLN